MKRKMKQKNGLTVTKDNYNELYPDMSKKLSYEQFCGKYAVEELTHCIGESVVRLDNGEEHTVYTVVNENLALYCYNGKYVWLYESTKKPFKCLRIPVLPNYYLDCEFGQAVLVYTPPLVGKEFKQTIRHYALAHGLPKKVKAELADLLVSTPDSVSVISYLRRYLRKEIYNATV